ncbi:putative enzyme involved in inositol metabolism [Halobacteroides halobius DSM 5150]|uniref:Putative enzyme involved in inositol metabolism n=1 Tax=Halobacteroides halobius (strain ATCC 35273 / DSM 5150 / MD-1) TaxID=748449 RepID=L0KBK7_HALHC|nr:5-deoxy-glucuronate isomerase [Halobacteroides halobius]AGB42381.1 putative enzyme involved in inositol metabolism [Halobacteroides halobius DSM 5150]
MLINQDGEFKAGYNSITELDGKYSTMLMDVGILKLEADQVEEVLEGEKESAYLLINGEVTFEWEGNKEQATRNSCFDEEPWVLHVPKGTKVKITAQAESEVLVQKTRNEEEFDAVFYTPEDCTVDIFGESIMNSTATRTVRTVFDYDSAPYSNMVMGESITHPGRWSSYPPHSHAQPEVYYYRFNKPQGFGCSLVGDDVLKVEHNDTVTIPGGLVHPQTSAPGYAMYICWMIRHLEANPWTDRVDDPDHEWLYNEDAKIWPED